MSSSARRGRSSKTVEYQSNWHIDAISEHLEAAARGDLKGILLINIPFRCMKSRIVNVMFQPWVWAQDPDPNGEGHSFPVKPGTWLGPGTKFLCTSHTAAVATKDSVTARRLLDSPWYQNNWGDRVRFTSDQNQKQRYENTAGGYRLSSYRGGELGEGGDINIADDPIKREEAKSDTVRIDANEWWDQTFRSRTNDPERTVFVVIMQRLHEKDTSGHILDKESNVTHLMLPMEFERARCAYSPIKTSLSDERIEARYLKTRQRWVEDGDAVEDKDQDELDAAPKQTVYRVDPRTEEGALLWVKRFARPIVDRLKVSLGEYGSAGQLQQRPAPREGGLFKRQWFEIVEEVPPALRKVRRWDLAATAQSVTSPDPDWTVGLLMSEGADGIYYVEHLTRFREDPFTTEQNIRNTASQDGPDVAIRLPQDPGQAGKVQAQYLIRQLAGYDVTAEPESGSKEVRAEPLASQARAGNVKLVRGIWNEAFLEELCNFPNATHDDQVDAASGAFAELAIAVHFYVAG